MPRMGALKVMSAGLTVLSCLLVSHGGNCNVLAQDSTGSYQYSHEPPREGRKPQARPWRDLVGARVDVEGIAWGVFEKGAGEYVILNRGVVYVEGSNFLRGEAQGRLVRVQGRLSSKVIPAANRERGAGGVFKQEFLELRDVKWEFIDKVTWPWLKTSADRETTQAK